MLGSTNILLPASHFDANFVLSNRREGYLYQSLLTAPPSSGINREQLFEESRTCLPRIWGSEYPEEQILDDFENYRGLSLLQIAMKLKVDVWRLGVAVRQGMADDDSMERLWAQIQNVEKVIICISMLLLNKSAPFFEINLLTRGEQDFFDVLSMARLGPPRTQLTKPPRGRDRLPRRIRVLRGSCAVRLHSRRPPRSILHLPLLPIIYLPDPESYNR
jgi:hypothetical protein